VDPTFLNGSSWNASTTLKSIKAATTEAVPWNGTGEMLASWPASLDLHRSIRYMQKNSFNTTLFAKVEPLDCLLQYTNLFDDRSDVILVTPTLSTTNNSLFAFGVSGSEDPSKTGWFWSLGNDFDSTKLDLANFRGGAAERMEKISNWSIVGQKIDYCLSSQVSTQNLCSVEYSQSIMISKSHHLDSFLDSFNCQLILIRVSRVHLQLRQVLLYIIYHISLPMA
jgi:hypothetical protein